MQNWRKINFSEIFQKIRDVERVKHAIKSLGYFPAILIYGLEIILLLKISQIILVWNF